MKTSVTWKEGMEFTAKAAENTLTMDAKAPLGKNHGATPKELVAMALSGCTAMDVIALLKKHKQQVKNFSVESDVQVSTAHHPLVFDKAVLSFHVEGEVSPDILINSVKLSQTKYCSVSAMLSKALPIEYRVFLNGTEIGSGHADFSSTPEAQVVS